MIDLTPFRGRAVVVADSWTIEEARASKVTGIKVVAIDRSNNRVEVVADPVVNAAVDSPR